MVANYPCIETAIHLANELNPAQVKEQSNHSSGEILLHFLAPDAINGRL